MSRELNENAKRLFQHEFTDESGKEYEGSEFGGFGDYMANKQIKLLNQAQEKRDKVIGALSTVGPTADQEGQIAQIFKGCIIYITGYVGVVSNIELQRLIVLHGGIHCQYLNGKTAVTHIIASNMTSRKKVLFSGYKIVTPDWITCSIEQKKLLPWSEFRTFRDETNSIFGTRSQETEDETEGARKLLKTTLPETAATSDPTNSSTYSRAPDNKITESLNKFDKNDILNDPAKDADLSESPNLKLAGTSIHSIHTGFKTLDPNFIKSFYEASRLHHLSMWRIRLKRRFQSLAQSANESTPKPPADTPVTPIIMHVDFDSFFVSVSLLGHPHLKDKPVAVSNSNSGNSDVASCNYVARKMGVRNGMWMSTARKRCPDIIVLAYDFPAYETASNHLYRILLGLGADLVFPVSVDEALLDISYLVQSRVSSELPSVASVVDSIASKIRADVRSSTGVEVSIGAGPNILMSKIAIRLAKPSGHLYIPESESERYLKDIIVRDLPGVGIHLSRKLDDMGVKTIGQLKEMEKTDLESQFGAKLGCKLWMYARGQDPTDIATAAESASAPKSVGVEVSWGVRCQTYDEIAQFVCNLSHELQSRMVEACVKCGNLSVRIYIRAEDAPKNPPKFLGHGDCDIFSRSKPIAPSDCPTYSTKIIAETALNLISSFEFDAEDLRGVGIQATALESGCSNLEIDVKPSIKWPGIRNHKLPFKPKISDFVDKEPSESSEFIQVRAQHADTETVAPLAISPKKMIDLRPRKVKRHTLTQNFLKPDYIDSSDADTDTYGDGGLDLDTIDEAVLMELPESIRQEILARGIFKVSKQTANLQPPPQAPPPLPPPRPPYVTLDGKSSVAQIRHLISLWIRQTSQGPHPDDVKKFYRYLKDQMDSETNWIKPLELVNWMQEQVGRESILKNSQKTFKEWKFLAAKFQEYVLQRLDQKGIHLDN